MAEIVCPHCHSTVPRDGTFCPRCRSFIGSAGTDTEERVPAAQAAVTDSGATTAKDVVEEAVKASMATSQRGSWDVLDELGDENDDPYPSDTEVLRRDEPTTPKRQPASRRPAKKPAKDAEPAQDSPPPVLARVVAWLVALPEHVRTGAHKLGAMPVAVFVIVLALLGSGGLLYAVGAFDEGRDEEPAQNPVRALAPASYKASCATKPSTTSAGKKVTFGADHLVDDKTSTAWRCAGDGSKQQVTLRFAKPVKVTKVALVPGWAAKDKTSKADRFKENGAPSAVTWRFDDTSVKQSIGTPRPDWAELSLKSPPTSKTVTLTIDAIRKGERRAMVAVSEIRVYGR